MDDLQRGTPVLEGKLSDILPSSETSESDGETVPSSVRALLIQEESVYEEISTHNTTISNENSPSVPPTTSTTTETTTTSSNNGFPIRVSTKGPPRSPLELAQRFLRWEKSEWSGEDPEWFMEPDMSLIKDVVRPCLQHCRLENGGISIEFFASGALNKLYTITSVDSATGLTRQCVFRIALPYAPWCKVENEVATTEYVRRKTRTPVPEIYAFDSSMDNALGLEWILMEKMPGFSLVGIWPSMSDPAKGKLVKQVAEYVDELSGLSFDKIGGLYIN